MTEAPRNTGAAQAAGASDETGSAAAGPAGGAAAGTPGATPPLLRRPLFWSGLLGLLLVLALALLVVQQWQREQEAAAVREAELAGLKADNDAFAAYIERLRALLKEDPCLIERELSTITPPAGVPLPVIPAVPAATPRKSGDGTPAPADGAAPADTGSPAREAPAAAADEHPAQADSAREQAAAPPATIDALLEQATVLLICQQGNSLNMGSGFFIAGDTILTNAHVLGDAKEAAFINKAIGRVHMARVILRTREKGLDFAVLKTGPMPVTPLNLNEAAVSRMQKVSAWGFPGAVSTADPKFIALLSGKAEVAPEVVSSDGTVNVVLEQVPPIIVHSATVSQGNSGGPLVNEAGEVVGINSMISMDDKSYRQSSLAIPSRVIAEFLRANRVPFSTTGATAAAGAAQI